MTPLTREWVKKAEGDFKSASSLLRARKDRHYDAVCFHSQQCAEKYLKARLQDAGIAFPKSHDLTVLLKLVVTVEPLWSALAPPLQSLADSAVEVRYPGKWAGKTEATEAFVTAKLVRQLVRRRFRLRL